MGGTHPEGGLGLPVRSRAMGAMGPMGGSAAPHPGTPVPPRTQIHPLPRKARGTRPPPRGVNSGFAPSSHPRSLSPRAPEASPRPGSSNSIPRTRARVPPKSAEPRGPQGLRGAPPAMPAAPRGCHRLCSPAPALPSPLILSGPLPSARLPPASPIHSPRGRSRSPPIPLLPRRPGWMRGRAAGGRAGRGGLLFAFIYCCVSWPSRLALMKTRPGEEAAPRLPPPGAAAAAERQLHPPDRGPPGSPGPGRTRRERGGNEGLRARGGEEGLLVTITNEINSVKH